MKRKISDYIYGILAFTGGVLFMTMGVLFYIDSTGGNVDNAIEIDGKIVKLVEREADSNIIPSWEFTVYNPWVQFTAGDGNLYQFLDRYASDDKLEYIIGMTVPVVYNELDPNESMILREAPMWGEHLILIGLGAFCFIMVWVIFKVGF